MIVESVTATPSCSGSIGQLCSISRYPIFPFIGCRLWQHQRVMATTGRVRALLRPAPRTPVRQAPCPRKRAVPRSAPADYQTRDHSSQHQQVREYAKPSGAGMLSAGLGGGGWPGAVRAAAGRPVLIVLHEPPGGSRAVYLRE